MTQRIFFLQVLLALAFPARAQPVERFEFERGLMGTLFRIVLYSVDSAAANAAAEAAFARVDSLNEILSDYLPDSELTALSKQSGSGEWIPVSRDLWDVVAAAQRLALQTDGSFDITIGPLTRLWRHAMRRQVMPDSSALQEAWALVGFQFIEMDSTDHAIRLTRAGMRLDAGGIAKGYAVDRAFEAVLKLGHAPVLVDGGGDLRIGDPPPGRGGWNIEMTGVDSIGTRVRDIVTLSNTAVATSGAEYRFLEAADIRYSHIVDPATGLGLAAEREVTVVAPSCLLADALSTAFSVAGADAAQRLVKVYPEIQARIVEARENGYYITDIQRIER